ncbi:hypothetical protein V5799_028098 [Amblyomma americanum]|uniref:Gamma-glutamyltransferase n=1 Tax=Amblyomma americanum TaxID=6943 RepID=A0AAQ4DDU5_AMBAM
MHAGGHLTERDLAGYHPRVGNASRVALGSGLNVWAAPPPSSGIVAGFILSLAGRFRPFLQGELIDDDTAAHRLVEAIKYGFALRSRLEDPLFGDVTKVINELLSFELVSSLASAMGDVPLKRIEDYGWEAPPVEDHGSSFVAVFGPDGDAAVMVASLNWDFGSMWLSPSTGVLLNNQLAAFSYPGRHGFQGYPPQAVNRLAPGKRPMSSASPLFITAERDELQCIVAPTGGPLAITGAAQTVMRAMWMGHSIKQAIDCGRLHHPLLPDSVRAEEFVDAVSRAIPLRLHTRVASSQLKILSDKNRNIAYGHFLQVNVTSP